MTLTMAREEEWTKTTNAISNIGLEAHIKQLLCNIAHSYGATTDSKDFNEEGLKISAEEIQAKLLEPRDIGATGGKDKKVIVHASKDDISEVLVKMNKEGFFKGGPTGLLMINVTGDLDNFVLLTGKKS